MSGACTYPIIEVYNHKNADTPEARAIFASGIFCSSTKGKINFIDSVEHEVGVEEKGLPRLDNASLILPIDHENSNAISFS